MAKATKSALTREQAEEFTHNLGQITAGDYGLIDMAVNTLQVPKALDMTTEEWVQKSLGGYVHWTVEKRREAVRALLDSGKTHEQIGEVLGVSEATVQRDKSMLEAGASTPKVAAAISTPETKAKKPTTKQLQTEIRRLIDEGKSDAQIAVTLGFDTPQGVSMARRAYRDEEAQKEAEAARARLAEIKANKDAEVSAAARKASDAKVEGVIAKTSANILEAFGFDPVRTLKEADEEITQLMELDSDHFTPKRIEECIALWAHIGDNLWVAGAKKGLDVSTIVQALDRMKGDA